MTYPERVSALTARIMAHVDLAALAPHEAADLMSALTELALLTPAQEPLLVDADGPSEVVRDNPTRNLVRCAAEAFDSTLCSAGYLDDDGVAHSCAETPGHGGQHLCACGVAWEDVVTPQVAGQCGASRNAGFGHTCVCHLQTHNTVPGPNLVEVPLHACSTCGQPWTV